jgi:hypothetical protein
MIVNGIDFSLNEKYRNSIPVFHLLNMEAQETGLFL